MTHLLHESTKLPSISTKKITTETAVLHSKPRDDEFEHVARRLQELSAAAALPVGNCPNFDWVQGGMDVTIMKNLTCNCLDLPRGAEWMIRGAYTPSFRVQTAPFGRCW